MRQNDSAEMYRVGVSENELPGNTREIIIFQLQSTSLTNSRWCYRFVYDNPDWIGTDTFEPYSNFRTYQECFQAAVCQFLEMNMTYAELEKYTRGETVSWIEDLKRDSGVDVTIEDFFGTVQCTVKAAENE